MGVALAHHGLDHLVTINMDNSDVQQPPPKLLSHNGVINQSASPEFVTTFNCELLFKCPHVQNVSLAVISHHHTD